MLSDCEEWNVEIQGECLKPFGLHAMSMVGPLPAQGIQDTYCQGDAHMWLGFDMGIEELDESLSLGLRSGLCQDSHTQRIQVWHVAVQHVSSAFG